MPSSRSPAAPSRRSGLAKARDLGGQGRRDQLADLAEQAEERAAEERHGGESRPPSTLLGEQLAVERPCPPRQTGLGERLEVPDDRLLLLVGHGADVGRGAKQARS